MSSAIDRAVMGMLLEEEEEPFDMPDLPEFCSSERNVISIMGRILNPDCQKVENLILDMPRKWQIYDRVRGIALSKEHFQFIFKYQQDMEEILNKGVHKYNEWTMAIDRWFEHPPPDYLQFIPVWIQLRNIPVNHYMVPAITLFGEFVGHVIEVAMDPERSQRKDYVRVKMSFDVSKPIRRSKVINLPKGGGIVTILNDFERIQKRCYSCQRLTHRQDKCHLILEARLEKRKKKSVKPSTPKYNQIRRSSFWIR